MGRLGARYLLPGPTVDTNLPGVESMASKELVSLVSSQAGQIL